MTIILVAAGVALAVCAVLALVLVAGSSTHGEYGDRP